MVISFHARDPQISDILALISFIMYLIAGILILKEKRLKSTILFIVGGFAGILWYIINFFIPGIFLPLVPTPEEIEFTLTFGMIFNGLIQDFVLIFSIGIVPIVITLKNRSSDLVNLLAIGGLIQIISILTNFGPDYGGLLYLPSVIITGIAMAIFSYFCYKQKFYLLIAFATTLFVSQSLLVFVF